MRLSRQQLVRLAPFAVLLLVVLAAMLVEPRFFGPANLRNVARGAAFLAGLQVGFWETLDDLAGRNAVDRIFTPQMPRQQREKLYRGWQRAVACARSWAESDPGHGSQPG